MSRVTRRWDDNGLLVGGIDYSIANGWKFRAEPTSIAERYTQLIDPNGSALMDGFMMAPSVAAESLAGQRTVEASPLPGDEDVALEIYKLMEGAEPEFEYEKPLVRQIATILARHREQATSPLREALRTCMDAIAAHRGDEPYNPENAFDLAFEQGIEALSPHPTKAEPQEVLPDVTDDIQEALEWLEGECDCYNPSEMEARYRIILAYVEDLEAALGIDRPEREAA